jgi:hypothetical protein
MDFLLFSWVRGMRYWIGHHLVAVGWREFGMGERFGYDIVLILKVEFYHIRTTFPLH